MSPLRDSQVPFAFALLVTGSGWLLNSALEQTKDALFLSYEWREITQADGSTLLKLILRNNSLTAVLTSGNIAIKCEKPCFLPLAQLAAGVTATEVEKNASYAAAIPVSPYQASGTAAGGPTDVQVTGVRLPPSASVLVEVHRAAKSEFPEIFYDVSDELSQPAIISGQFSLRAWLAQNYADALTWASGIALALIAIWTVVMTFSKSSGRKTDTN